MVVGGCWPAMQTAMMIGSCWPAVEAARVVLFVLASNEDSNGVRLLLSSNADNHDVRYLFANGGETAMLLRKSIQRFLRKKSSNDDMLNEENILSSAKHWDPYRASLCEIIVVRRVP